MAKLLTAEELFHAAENGYRENSFGTKGRPVAGILVEKDPYKDKCYNLQILGTGADKRFACLEVSEYKTSTAMREYRRKCAKLTTSEIVVINVQHLNYSKWDSNRYIEVMISDVVTLAEYKRNRVATIIGYLIGAIIAFVALKSCIG
jgi:hypothetical protein